MQLELITTLDGFEALQSEWNLLLPQNATNEIFLTWEWQSTWWHAYRPGDLWVIAARNEAGTLVAIAPWFIEHPDRVVRTIGCVEVTDYLDVLVAPSSREAFYVALTDFVVERCADYSRIDLCNILESSRTLDILPRLLTERGFAVQVRHEDVCPFIPLPDDFEAYLNQLDAHQRHELRRKMRRAQNAQNETVDWYIVGPQHDLAAETQKFLSLMAASQPNKAQFLQSAGNRRFFEAIIRQLAECGWLQLSFLTVNGEPAATYLNFDFNNRILVYNSGIMPGTHTHLSPGIVLMCYNIRHAIERGRSVFDFLQGGEEYKYRMGAQDRAVMMLEAVREPAKAMN